MMAPRAMKGPNGIAVLRPGLPGDHERDPDHRPDRERREEGDDDPPPPQVPEEQADEAGELHVPHPHPGRRDERDDEEPSGAGDAAEQRPQPGVEAGAQSPR